MSTYWGYYCVNCDEETDHWYNHGEEILEQYFKAYKILSKHPELDRIEINVEGGWAVEEMWEFLDEHKDHEIAIKSEYGKVLEIGE